LSIQGLLCRFGSAAVVAARQCPGAGIDRRPAIRPKKSTKSSLMLILPAAPGLALLPWAIVAMASPDRKSVIYIL
jgi:hypothetical protein